MLLVVLFLIAVFAAASIGYAVMYHRQPLSAVRQQILSDAVCYAGVACTLFVLWIVGITLPGVSPWLGGYLTVVFTVLSIIMPLRTHDWSKQCFSAQPSAPDAG